MSESSAAAAVSNSIENGIYKYIHDIHKGPPEAIDVHHIIVQTSGIKIFTLCFFALLLLATPITTFVLHQVLLYL